VVRVGLGILEGVLMVTENMLMMMLALNFGFGAYLLMKLDSKNADIGRMKLDFKEMVDSLEMPTLNLDSIKDEMFEIIEDLIGQMRVPTAIDHAAGFMTQFLQMKAHKQMAEMGLVQPEEPHFEENLD
jgi:hypothetical protein